MSAAPRPASSSAPTARRTRIKPETLGLPVMLIIVWLTLEYTRPPNPMKVPYMISLALGAGWLFHSAKRWNPQIVMMLLFVVQMAMMIPFSENTFAAAMTTREVMTVIVFISVPMAHFIDSLKRLETVLYVWVVLFVYMAVIALMNGGNGPGGAHHGVDENYTALFLSIAIALAFFATFTVERLWLRLALYAACILFVGGIVLGSSRGGFLALVTVAGLCWWYSPARIVTALLGVVAIGVFFYFIPESYLAEVQTIGDTSEGTADARLTFWGIAFEMFLDHPIFGVGPGNFPWLTHLYQTVREDGTALGMNVTHSLYFELLSEMGLGGVILWGGILYCDFRDSRLVSRVSRKGRRLAERLGNARLTPPERKQLRLLRDAETWSKALTASLLGFLVGSLFLSTLYYTTFWLLTALIVALREATFKEAAALNRSIAARIGANPSPAALTPPDHPNVEPGPTGASSREAALSRGLLGR